MEYKDIIENILEVYNINAAEFSEKIDVQRSSISHILSGRNNPSLDFLLKVKEKFPELRWEYLMLKKLPMYEYENKIVESEKKQKIDELPSLFPDIDEEEPEKEKLEHSDELKNEVKKEKKEEKKENLEKSENSIIIEETEKRLKNKNQITKVIWFYADGTFESFEPKS
ncbi:helix-turn-helix domain-containing protein [Weeksellaceae bacterium TAE3-ERU29]|nr:helix-turn-helix domain-containing protein [Weeksellaceae bacterium TAE3-ERU29]